MEQSQKGFVESQNQMSLLASMTGITGFLFSSVPKLFALVKPLALFTLVELFLYSIAFVDI